MPERLANVGYMALKKETTKGTPVVPNVYLHLLKESLMTDIAPDFYNPVAGVRLKNYEMYMGQRNHKGSATILAEPNTAQYLFDMLMSDGTITGAGPYTHPFTLDIPVNSYTVDMCKGEVVFRFWGVEAREISPAWEDNKMHLETAMSALGSFSVREIATVATTTITLKTDYDPAPNKGLVAGDLVRVYKPSDGSVLNTTVSSVNADGITVVLGASAEAFAAGDLIHLRPATPSYSILTPFLWARTEFRFADTAANALTAAHTPVERGSTWKLIHSLEDDNGAQRSGSFDPAALVRSQAEAQATIKKFFDTTEDLNRFNKLGGQALVIRHFSETGYELRITLNSIKAKEKKDPLETGTIIYMEQEYEAVYKAADGQGFDVKIINNVST